MLSAEIHTKKYMFRPDRQKDLKHEKKDKLKKAQEGEQFGERKPRKRLVPFSNPAAV